MAPRRFALTAACLLLFAAAAPARAAQKAGSVVAAAGGLQLRASSQDGQLCLEIAPAGAGTGADALGETCSDPPRSHFSPLQARPPGVGGALALALPADVAAVSLETADQTRAFPTVAAAGFGARFLLVPDAGKVRLERFYAADGTLLGAATDEADDEGEPRGGHVVLHAPGATVRASRGTALEPDPVSLDRTVGKTCVTARVPHSASSFCQSDDDPRPALEVDAASACAPAHNVLFGLAAASIRRVEVQLGSGRRLRAATRALPAAFGGARAVAVRIPRGEAVRFVRGLGSGDRTVTRRVLRQAPGGLPCRNGGGSQSVAFFGRAFDDGGGTRPGPSAAVAAADGHRLLVADAGEELCAGIDRIPRHTCGRPPVEPSLLPLSRRGAVVGGVLSVDVAAVDLDLDRGPTLHAPTTDGPAYTGRYAGKLRYLLAQVPAGRRVVRAILRGAGGQRLGRTDVVLPLHDRRVRRLGSTGLTVRHLQGGSEGHPLEAFCVLPSGAGLFSGSGGACSTDSAPSALATVSCRPRRALIYGRLPRGVRGVALVLADGRELGARVIRLRASEGGVRAWTLVPPRGADVRAVRFLGRLPRPDRFASRPKRLQPFRLPPAARQCGYDTSLDLG